MNDTLISDPRVLDGMKTQLSVRAAMLQAGSRRLGWKAGFGAPAALEQFRLAGPLVGFMLEEARLDSGTTVSLAGWTKPVAEPEIAVWMGADLDGGQDEAAVRAAIAGLGPAIELADLNPPPTDVAEILAGNIYHRHVILGDCDTGRAGGSLDDIECRVTRGGNTLPVTTELEGNTGRILDVVGHIASTLSSCGELLRRGDVIICGSILPPLFLEPADTAVWHALSPLGTVSVDLTYG